MIIILLSLCIVSSFSFAETISQDRELFHQLRERHEKTIPAFTAEMDKKSSSLLLKGKIKGKYIVQVSYEIDKGIELLVKDVDPFYENILSSYATSINMIMLPLLSTSGYIRLQKRFSITNLSDKEYQVVLDKGDDHILYLIKEGSLGLADNIIYFENNKKIFSLIIKWLKVEDYYIPVDIKGISYEKTRKAASFKLENILLK